MTSITDEATQGLAVFPLPHLPLSSGGPGPQGWLSSDTSKTRACTQNVFWEIPYFSDVSGETPILTSFCLKCASSHFTIKRGSSREYRDTGFDTEATETRLAQGCSVTLGQVYYIFSKAL